MKVTALRIPRLARQCSQMGCLSKSTERVRPHGPVNPFLWVFGTRLFQDPRLLPMVTGNPTKQTQIPIPLKVINPDSPDYETNPTKLNPVWRDN